MTSVTVGSGGTYADWAAFRTAIAAASPLADDWEATQISNVADAGMSFTVIDLNGHTLTLKNGSPHGGDPTVGYKWTCSGDNSFNLVGSNSGTFEAKDFNIDSVGDKATVYLGVINGGALGLFHDILATGGSGSTQRVSLGCYTGTGATCYAWNIAASNADEAVFIFLNNADANTVIIENSSGLGAYYGFDSSGGAAITVRNCVSGNNGGDDFHNMAASSGANNASEDTTATTGWSVQSGGHTGIVLATEFESTDPTASTYMKVTNAGVLYDSGTTTTISGNTAGNRGDQRPQSNGDISVGVDEFPSPSAGGGAGSGGGLSGAITAAMAMGY